MDTEKSMNKVFSQKAADNASKNKSTKKREKEDAEEKEYNDKKNKEVAIDENEGISVGDLIDKVVAWWKHTKKKIDKHFTRKQQYWIVAEMLCIVVTSFMAGIPSQWLAHVSNNKKIIFEFFVNLYYTLFTGTGRVLGLLFILTSNVVAYIIYKKVFSKKDDMYYDEERNINISLKGDSGTAHFMLEHDKEFDECLDVGEPGSSKNTILGLNKKGETYSLKEKMPLGKELNFHTIVTGSSGVRKSRSKVIPDIFGYIQNGYSFIATDPKGEVYALTSELARAHGMVVKKIDLINPKYSDAFNLLQFVGGDTVKAQIFVDVFMANASEGIKDAFWGQLETTLLKSLVLLITSEGYEGECSFSELYQLVANKSMSEISSAFSKLNDTHPAKSEFNLFMKTEKDEKIQTSAVEGLGLKLDRFAEPSLVKMTGYDDIDFTLPAKQPCAYYILISDQHNSYNFFAALIFVFMSIVLCEYADSRPSRKTDVPVIWELDEVMNIMTIPNFVNALPVYRARGISVTMIMQNVGQAMTRYPDEQWRTLMANCDISVFLGTNDRLTSKEFSDRMGVMTIDKDSKGKAVNWGLMNLRPNMEDRETTTTQERALMTPDELEKLDNDYQILLLRGHNPLKCRKFDYSLHPLAEELKQYPEVSTKSYYPDWWKASYLAYLRNVEKVKKGQTPTISERLLEMSEIEMLSCIIDGEESRFDKRNPEDVFLEIAEDIVGIEEYVIPTKEDLRKAIDYVYMMRKKGIYNMRSSSSVIKSKQQAEGTPSEDVENKNEENVEATNASASEDASTASNNSSADTTDENASVNSNDTSSSKASTDNKAESSNESKDMNTEDNYPNNSTSKSKKVKRTNEAPVGKSNGNQSNGVSKSKEESKDKKAEDFKNKKAEDSNDKKTEDAKEDTKEDTNNNAQPKQLFNGTSSSYNNQQSHNESKSERVGAAYDEEDYERIYAMATDVMRSMMRDAEPKEEPKDEPTAEPKAEPKADSSDPKPTTSEAQNTSSTTNPQNAEVSSDKDDSSNVESSGNKSKDSSSKMPSSKELMEGFISASRTEGDVSIRNKGKKKTGRSKKAPKSF